MPTAAEKDAPAGNSRWIRLIPLAILVYIISFMDRTNIGFALDGMEKSLHFNATAAGLAGGIFLSTTCFCKCRAVIWPNTGARKNSSAS